MPLYLQLITPLIGLCAILLALCAGLLWSIASAAWSGELRGKQGPPGPPGTWAGQSPDAVRKDLSRVLKKTANGWEHHGWVETDSPAYQAFWNAVGFAVQPHGKEIDPGKQ